MEHVLTLTEATVEPRNGPYGIVFEVSIMSRQLNMVGIGCGLGSHFVHYIGYGLRSHFIHYID